MGKNKKANHSKREEDTFVVPADVRCVFVFGAIRDILL